MANAPQQPPQQQQQRLHNYNRGGAQQQPPQQVVVSTAKPKKEPAAHIKQHGNYVWIDAGGHQRGMVTNPQGANIARTRSVLIGDHIAEAMDLRGQVLEMFDDTATPVLNRIIPIIARLQLIEKNLLDDGVFLENLLSAIEDCYEEGRDAIALMEGEKATSGEKEGDGWEKP